QIPPLSLLNQALPEQVADGNLLVSAWIEEGELRFARTTADGRFLDGGGFDLGTATIAHLLLTASDYFVIAQDATRIRSMRIPRHQTQRLDVFATDVADGQLLDAATDGNDVVIVWSESHAHRELHAAHVHGDTVEVHPNAITPATFDQVLPKLIWT